MKYESFTNLLQLKLNRKTGLLLKFLLLIITVTLILFEQSLSQSINNDQDDSLETKRKFYLGFSGGWKSVRHTEAKFNNRDVYCNNYIDEANGNGYYFGLSLKFDLSDTEESLNSLMTNIFLERSTSLYKSKSDDIRILVEAGNYDTVPTTMNADIDLSLLTLELLYDQKISKLIPLSLTCGIYFSYIESSNLLETYRIESDNPKHKFQYYYGYKYLDNGKAVILNDREINHINDYLFGIKFGLGYEIHISKNILLIPEIAANIPLTKLVHDIDWRVSYHKAGISIMYKIN